MRMKYMYYLLKENYAALENFKLSYDTYKVANNSYNRGIVENWEEAQVALRNVSVISSINNVCSMILDNPFFIKKNDYFYIPYETYQEIKPQYKIFLEHISAIIDFCEAAGFGTIEKGFDIKMPSTEDFDEFSKNIELLNKSISQCPYLKVDNEKITLVKTDIGSIWFEFGIIATGASVLLLNLSKIIDKCIKIKSHYITVKEQEENWRRRKLDNDMIETLVEANKQMMNSVLSEAVEELKQEIPEIKLKGDDEERMKFSLNTIANLMEKGLQIHASIDSPPEVKELFPTSDELISFLEPQKLLSSSNECIEE